MRWVWLMATVVLRACVAQEEASPVVHTTGGDVQGRVVNQPTAPLQKYYVFQGIRYGKPPTGDLRFKDPEPADSWEGVYNATKAGNDCPQKEFLTGIYTGEEDCLFLNVYTSDPPEAWSEVKRPVVVFVHGGGFEAGSGNILSTKPDAILQEHIVLVTINYRLSVLGFLNTEDSAAPGNAGLKDVVLALRWIRDNAKAFGGDPGSVTVLGLSSGAAIAHYLLLSPLAEGLLSRAVAMSGSALATWALQRQPRRAAQMMRGLYNASDSAACGADADLVTCLRSIPAERLVMDHDKATDEQSLFHPIKNTFVPSVEAPGSSPAPFLTEEPETLIRKGRVQLLPFMTGFTSGEGIFYLKVSGLLTDPSLWPETEENLDTIFVPKLPHNLQTTIAMDALRGFYMGDKRIANAGNDSDALNRFIKLAGDILFSVSVIQTARLHAALGEKVFLYEFTHEADVPLLKTFLYAAPQIPGVAHGEDITYFFEVGNPLGDERELLRQRVALVANFARTGNPTPEAEYPVEKRWPAYSADKETYMDMGDHFVPSEHVLQDRMHFWRELARCQGVDGVCADPPIVRVQEGALKGQRLQSISGCSYVAFRGVPYASPPVGPLRFAPPQPVAPWPDIRSAETDPSQCTQNAMSGGSVVGTEDCLALNVYAPAPASQLADARAVMVWVHGGGFASGSGRSQEYGPGYVVCEDVVMVAINYRLGPLGFLQLGEAAPGNAGLKDQALALRWVQRNIAAFGGDPNKVTIVGESAGAASVHLHVLSPMSKGLFQRAVLQSGSALAPWAMQHDPEGTARRLATAVGCPSTDTAPDAVVTCLRGVPAHDIVKAAGDGAKDDYERNRIVTFTFVPTVEVQVPGVEPFLPEPSQNIIARGSYTHVPMLLGVTSRESVLHMAFRNFRDASVAHSVDAAWDLNVLPELRLPNKTHPETALKNLREFFMGGKPLDNDTMYQYMDMLSDIAFTEGLFFTIRHASAFNDTLFVYVFDVDDELNMLKTLLKMKDVPGAGHADELGYLFDLGFLPKVTPGSSADIARRRMVRMWTNFIKTGNPTPVDDPLLGVHWKPYTKKEADYLDIGQELKVHAHFFAKRMEFWESFYNNFTQS